MTVVADPFNLAFQWDFCSLKRTLLELGYTDQVMKRFARMNALEREYRLSDGSPLSALLRVFRFGMSVSVQCLSDAIGHAESTALFAAGILTRVGDQVSACGSLIWSGEDILLCDKRESHDQVMWLGGSSELLARMTPRRKVSSVLDLGTGSGVHGILCARHSDRVIATDLSPRALNFAAMNARLNGRDNIEFRLGNFFEPVANEKFDLIVANPPYVVSPDAPRLYMGNGKGDSVSEHVVKNAARHLEEGGVAVLLTTWCHATDDDWGGKPSGWTDELGCDVWWLRIRRDEAVSYAGTWIDLGNGGAIPEGDVLFRKWLQYYREIDAEFLSFGIVVLRKRSTGCNWSRFEDFADMDTGVRIAQIGDQIATIFAVEDCEALRDEAVFLETRFRLHPDHHIHESRTFKDGSWESNSIRISSTCGVPYSTVLDAKTLSFIGMLDAGRTVRDAIRAVAVEGEFESEEVTPGFLEVAAQLLRDGLIIPL